MNYNRFTIGTGVDCKEYSWVKVYLKEQGYLEEIKALQGRDPRSPEVVQG